MTKRHLLFSLCLGTCITFGLTAQALADTRIFKVDGRLSDSAVVSGSITIDVTLGQVTGIDVFVGSPDNLHFSSGFQGPIARLIDGVVEAQSFNAKTRPTVSLPAFFFIFPTPTLVGYGGGAICPVPYCTAIGVSGLITSSGSPSATFLTLTPVSAASAGLSVSTGMCFEAAAAPVCSPVTARSGNIEPLTDFETGLRTYHPESADVTTSATFQTAAAASFGTLKSRAILNVGMSTLSPQTDLVARSSFVDTFTITGGIGLGYVRFGLNLDGRSIDSSLPPGFNGPLGSSAVTYTIDTISSAHMFNNTIDTTNTFVRREVYSPSIPIKFGVPFTMYFEVATKAAVRCFVADIDLISCVVTTPGMASTDFFSTAILDSIAVQDSLGNPITDFDVTSESGTQYTETGVVDTTPPTTTATTSPAPNAAGWNTTNVSVTLNASDGPHGSGVSALYYMLSGAHSLGWTAAGSNVNIAIVNEGVTTVTYFAIDNSGNIETSHSLTVRLDKTSPLINAAASAPILWPPTGKQVPDTIYGVLSDALSGIDPSTARFEVVDKYDQVQPTGPVPVDSSGHYAFTVNLEAGRLGSDLDGRTYTIVVTAKDKAGNAAAATTIVRVPHDQGGGPN